MFRWHLLENGQVYLNCFFPGFRVARLLCGVQAVRRAFMQIRGCHSVEESDLSCFHYVCHHYHFQVFSTVTSFLVGEFCPCCSGANFEEIRVSYTLEAAEPSLQSQ